MKKTVNINLSGRVFYIDDDAYARLKEYLTKIEKYFKSQEGGEEIFKDIESRIAELLGDRISDKSGVVTMEMVEEVMGKMGQPEDFEDDETADNKKEEEPKYEKFTYGRANKRLFRDVDSRVLGGVCSGIAAYLNMDPVLVRILFVLIMFVGVGIIIPIYIILWIVVPAAITTAQKLEMRGENVTVSNIEKAIKREYEDVKQQFSKMRDSKTYKKGESWWNKFTKRDKTMIAIIAIGGALFLLANIAQVNFFHPDFYHQVNFNMGHVPFFHFPGIVVLVFILLIIGLIFKTIFKAILYIIAFLLLAVVGLKIIGILMGSVFMLC